MITVERDEEFERDKRRLLQQGIRALSLQLKREDITSENLGLFLYTKDPEVISKDCRYPWQEFLDEAVEDREAIKNNQYSKAVTKIWLATIGYKEFNQRWQDIEIVNYLWNFQYYWSLVLVDLEGEKDEVYYKPSLLQWALYLTVRGPIPKTFPINGIFTYAIKRWGDIRNKVIEDVMRLPNEWENPRAQEFALKYLIQRLKALKHEGERFIAKEDGKVPKENLVELDGIEIDAKI
jgi:hypothetical protein